MIAFVTFVTGLGLFFVVTVTIISLQTPRTIQDRVLIIFQAVALVALIVWPTLVPTGRPENNRAADAVETVPAAIVASGTLTHAVR